jgi:hypothetical protein
MTIEFEKPCSAKESMKILREQRRKEHVCIGCGNPLDNTSKAYC